MIEGKDEQNEQGPWFYHYLLFSLLSPYYKINVVKLLNKICNCYTWSSSIFTPESPKNIGVCPFAFTELRYWYIILDVGMSKDGKFMSGI